MVIEDLPFLSYVHKPTEFFNKAYASTEEQERARSVQDQTIVTEHLPTEILSDKASPPQYTTGHRTDPNEQVDKEKAAIILKTRLTVLPPTHITIFSL
ncbi:hypothetical protein BHYA_0038g00290 [Botrytis hyacinthi]|uniref:Uncharacterized protein n=1 Tax=Botrytis hyacinthi TaxID=278943 RepID=A0A4Z1GU67_9HELO|nr:hypothetical protein BHYA_0038g00290 [Botrytis hyacinthi]